MKIVKAKNWSDIPKNFTGIVEFSDGSKYWYKKGEPHRENAPAIEWVNGSKYWYKEGKRHREDGPAIEIPNGNKEWYKEGKRHRDDGPAVVFSGGTKQWWLEGKHYSEINLKDYVILDHDKGKYGLMCYKLLGKNDIFEHPDIPGLIIK
jgi:hypothetical protein